jgi:hypothetical protein
MLDIGIVRARLAHARELRVLGWGHQQRFDNVRAWSGQPHTADLSTNSPSVPLSARFGHALTTYSSCADRHLPYSSLTEAKSLFSVASRAPAFESCSTRRVAVSDVVRVHRTAGSARFRALLTGLVALFRRGAPLAATFEAGRIDGRAKIKIEVSA